MATNKKKQSRKKKKRAKPRSTSTSNLPTGMVGGSMLTSTRTKTVYSLALVLSVYLPLDILHHQSSFIKCLNYSKIQSIFIWICLTISSFDAENNCTDAVPNPTFFVLSDNNPFLLLTLTPALLSKIRRIGGYSESLCPPWIVNKEFGNDQVFPENT